MKIEEFSDITTICFLSFVNRVDLHQCLMGYCLMGIVFIFSLQSFQRVGIIPSGMSPTEHGMDILIVLVQRFVSAECI